MTDDTIETTPVEQQPAPAEPSPEPEPMTAADRLRAFEDEHFGKEAVRINDRIERGYGSPYHNAAPEIRKQYEALEKLIVAEQKLADAKGVLAQAEADHRDAEKACDAAPVE